MNSKKIFIILSFLLVALLCIGSVAASEDNFHDFDVCFLVVTTEVINFTYSPLLQHGKDTIAVILNIEPITHIQSLSINRQWLVLGSIVDHQRDELLRELVGAIVIAATRDSHRKTVSAMVGLYQQIS